MTPNPTRIPHRLILLWGALLIFGLASVAGWLWLHDRVHKDVFAQKLHETQILNDAFVEHTRQVINNVDIAITAVREHFLRVRSSEELHRFISQLPLTDPIIESIYLINADGQVSLSHNRSLIGRNVGDRDYLAYHRGSSVDRLHIGSVQLGRVTGDYLFRVSRRITDTDGSFGGVVLATLRPRVFSDYYRRLNADAEGLTSLIGIEDRKIRARAPHLSNDLWDNPIQIPFENQIGNVDSGHIRATSQVDGIEREFVFRQVGELPLLLTTAFSDRDIERKVSRHMQPITIGFVAVSVVLVMLTSFLTIVFRQREAFRQLVTFDVLTGVYRRHHFLAQAEKELSRAKRYGSELSVLMVDIDHFKLINDTHGHQIGDRVLQRLGTTFRETLREADFVGRIGGEEFAAVLPQTSILKAFEVAERLRQTVDKTEIPLDHGLPINITVSIGACSLHDPEVNIDTLLARADQALYDAKNQGRNQVCVYEIASCEE